MPRARQRVPQPGDDQPPRRARIAEPHLGFRGVHVHVHQPGIAGDVQHHRRVAPARQHVGVGRAQRPRQQPVAHRAAPHRQVLPRRRPSRRRRQPRQPRQAQTVPLGVNLEAVVGELGPQHPPRPRRRVLRPAAQHRAPAPRVRQREPHAGGGQRQPAQHLGDGLRLGHVAAQELQPRRRRAEQARHLDHRARRRRAGLGRAEPPPVAGDARALPARRARDDRDPRHRAERGQRLAAEPERADRQQVGPVDLGGRVPRQRHRQVGRAHSVAVVGDPDQGLAAARVIHRDPARARVERVLNQLLDRGGRALDHLAGGDAVHRALVQRADRGRRLSVRRVHAATPSSAGRARLAPEPS